MTDKKTEALKLALEALKQIDEAMPFPVAKLAQQVIREALAEQPACEHEWLRGACLKCGQSIEQLAQQDIPKIGCVNHDCDKCKEQQQEQYRQIDQLIQERDHRDEIIDKLCDAVLGSDRYEWSSQYFFEDAVREVEERMAALEQPAQELLAWKNAAIRVGEELSSVGPNGYYNMTAEQWLAWAMDQQPRGKNSLAEQPAPQQEPIGDDWTPCMKLPVIVHVRQQRKGETHVSTREGITPVKPDDLIMRGVSGEEYPIGRAIFEQTYSLDTSPPASKPWVGLTDEEIEHVCIPLGAAMLSFTEVARAIEAKLKEKNT